MENLIEIAKDKAELTIDKVESEKIALMNCVEGLDVTCDDELAIATDLLKKIKGRIKWLEDDRKLITVPINQSLRLINAKYKPSSEFLTKIAKTLDSEKIVPYSLEKIKAEREAEEKRRQEEFDRIAREQEAMQKVAKDQDSSIAKEVAVELEQEALKVAERKTEVTQTFKTGNSATTLKGRWVCEVVDENKVPRSFCTPNQTLLNMSVKDGTRNIAGCEIKEIFSSASR